MFRKYENLSDNINILKSRLTLMFKWNFELSREIRQQNSEQNYLDAADTFFTKQPLISRKY